MPMNAAQRKALLLLRKAADRAVASIGQHQTGALMFLIGMQLLSGQSSEVTDAAVEAMAEAARETLAANPHLIRH